MAPERIPGATGHRQVVSSASSGSSSWSEALACWTSTTVKATHLPRFCVSMRQLPEGNIRRNVRTSVLAASPPSSTSTMNVVYEGLALSRVLLISLIRISTTTFLIGLPQTSITYCSRRGRIQLRIGPVPAKLTREMGMRVKQRTARGDRSATDGSSLVPSAVERRH